MNKPTMVTVAALLAVGLFAPINRAAAQEYPDKEIMRDTFPSARETSPSLMSASDTSFMSKVGYANNAEIKMSELALDRSTNDAVRQFAQRMIDDHTQLGDKFKKLADYWNVLPPMSIDSMDRRAYNRLSNLSGADFDRAYINWQIGAHKKAIDLFDNRLGYTRIQDLTNFTRQTLPTLHEHLKMAYDLRKTLSH